MTEAEWLACDKPESLIKFLTGRTSERKLQLFAVDCCRRVKHLLRGGHVKNGRKAIGVVDRHVEGLATFEQMRAALNEVFGDARDASASIAHAGDVDNYATELAVKAVWFLREFQVARTALCSAHAIACDALGCDGDPVLERIATEYKTRGWPGQTQAEADETEVQNLPGYARALTGECARQTQLLWDIFGNPFHPVTFSPEWRTSNAVALARQMYESRDFSAMPILADALQDAGCDNPDILNHCRDAKQVHVRGCWVVDLVLGKA